MGELEQYREVHEVVLPTFSNESTEACANEGEEVLTLRLEARGTQNKISQGEMVAAFDTHPRVKQPGKGPKCRLRRRRFSRTQ